MSLISEALKKARQEAARQEALRRGATPPSLPHHMPFRRARRAPWLPALAGGFLAAALLTAAALWLFTAAEAPPPPASGEVPGSPAAVATGPPSLPAGAGDGDAAAPRRAASGTGDSQPATPPAGAAATPSAPRPAPTRAAAPEPAVPPAAVAEPPAPVPAGAPGPASRRAELADGTVLVLQGIAITDGHPVALVNGVAVGPGERIAGFTVEAIGATRVELRRGSEVVVLALR